MAPTRKGGEGGGAIGSGFIRNKRGSHEFQWNEECCCFVRCSSVSALDMSVVVVGRRLGGRSARKAGSFLPSFLLRWDGVRPCCDSA